MKPTIEESTTEKVPQHLQEIVERVLSQNNILDSLQKDLFFIVIIVLMLENGFLPLDNNNVEIQNPVTYIDLQNLNKWKSPLGVFDATFVLNGFQTIPLKLIMSPLGATMLVNVIINNFNGETYSVCLPISRYVVSPLASTVPMIFRDLKHLSVNFKNKIVSAVKSRILSHCGYPSASLIGLPDDVLFKIALNLPTSDVIKLRKTCNTINCLIHSDLLWHDLCKRDFKDLKNENDLTWMEVYKQAYLQTQKKPVRNNQNAAGSLHDYMDYSDYRAYIDNPLWDII